MKELKVGDRIDLHELISDGGYSSLKKYGYKGKQAIEGQDTLTLTTLHFVKSSPSIPRTLEEGSLVFYGSEIKKIGTFIVKSLKT